MTRSSEDAAILRQAKETGNTREPVAATKRRPMTPARKRRIHAAWNGLCGMCRRVLPVNGPAVIYDHMIALEIGGPDTDGNVQLLCADPCNKMKYRGDIRSIAKLRRLLAEPKPSARPLKSRGFDRTRTRHFDGTVTRREA